MDLHLENISLSFNNKVILDQLSIQIPQGHKLSVSGSSGRGKSSFLNLLLGFVRASEGALKVDEQILSDGDFTGLRKSIAWLPQDLSLQIDTVEELVLYPFNFTVNKDKRPEQHEINSLLEKFGLEKSILGKKTSEISGGEKQRLLLISCVLQKKPLLLLDEPTSSLDKNVRKIVADYFIGLKNQTVIAATHDQYWIDKTDSVLNLDLINE